MANKRELGPRPRTNEQLRQQVQRATLRLIEKVDKNDLPVDHSIRNLPGFFIGGVRALEDGALDSPVVSSKRSVGYKSAAPGSYIVSRAKISLEGPGDVSHDGSRAKVTLRLGEGTDGLVMELDPEEGLAVMGENLGGPDETAPDTSVQTAHLILGGLNSMIPIEVERARTTSPALQTAIRENN